MTSMACTEITHITRIEVASKNGEELTSCICMLQLSVSLVVRKGVFFNVQSLLCFCYLDFQYVSFGRFEILESSHPHKFSTSFVGKKAEAYCSRESYLPREPHKSQRSQKLTHAHIPFPTQKLEPNTQSLRALLHYSSPLLAPHHFSSF